MDKIGREVRMMCEGARKASAALALMDTQAKNACLEAMARALLKDTGAILKANAEDLRRAKAIGLSGAMVDRLTLNAARIGSMASEIRAVAKLADPVGVIDDSTRRPNGLLIRKVRIPIGVILIIYESRPNVTSDCAALCLKSGNSVILRGGSEAIDSNRAICASLKKAVRASGAADGAITFVAKTQRGIVRRLLAQTSSIDLVIPRGGESLIREVTRLSRIPVIKHYKGICHTYIDERCDPDMALRICLNAKVQRPGVCNAMETMLVHRRIAPKFLPAIAASLRRAGVEIRGCPATRRILKGVGVKRATERDWCTEYLDLILSVKVVKDIDEAIAHIAQYGSRHSDAIVTRDRSRAEKFLKEVDSACVYVNASTRFTDGNQFGKGSEIGISTDKVGARGPMGLAELTSYKYVITGSGQVRT